MRFSKGNERVSEKSFNQVSEKDYFWHCMGKLRVDNKGVNELPPFVVETLHPSLSTHAARVDKWKSTTMICKNKSGC